MHSPLLRVGLGGLIATAICWFTPVLVWLLPPLGLAWVVEYLDYALLPLFAVFGLMILAGWSARRQRRER